MKIAVQMFGHMRTCQQTGPVLKQKLINKINCDVFIHTWDMMYHDSEQADCDSISQSLSSYNPVFSKVEKQDANLTSEHYRLANKEPRRGINTHLSGLKFMLHSMIEVNALRIEYEQAHNCEYDYVVFVRPDILLTEDFDINLVIKDFNFNTNTLVSFVNNPVITVVDRRINIIYMASDIFFITTPHVANKLLSSIDSFDTFYVNYPAMFPEKVYHPESSFNELVVNKGIAFKTYIFSYTIVRKDPQFNIEISLDASERYEPLNDFFAKHTRLKKYKKRLLYSLFLLILSVIVNGVLIIG